MMDSGEISFLQDQVQRLNAVLQHYQEKYGPLEKSEMESIYKQGDPAPPWLTSRTMLSPLVTEYDKQIKELHQQTTVYKAELKDLQGKVEKLVKENSSLHEELKSVIGGQLDTLQSNLGGAHAEEVAEKELIDNMRKQIELLEKERQTANEMWQETVQELDRLASEHRDVLGTTKAQASTHHAIESKGVALMRDNQQLRENNFKMEAANRHMQEVASAQGLELDGLRDQLRKVKTDLRTKSIQLNEATSIKDTVQQQLQTKDKDLAEARSRAQSAETRLPLLEEGLRDVEQKVELLSQENGRLLGARKELEDRIRAMHQRCTEAETKEYEATVQVRESIQMAENALLEKDQAMIREQQKSDEVQRLQETMSKLVQEAGRRTRQEVDGIRKQCNTNIAKLMEEVEALEMENAEKQAEIDRALREKRAVEHELEQVYKEGTAATGDQRVHELQNRMIATDRLKDEAMIRAQQLEKNMQRIESNHEEEKSRSMLVIDQLKQRLDKVSKECENISSDRLRLTEDLDEVQKKMIQVRRDKEDSMRTAAKEMASLEQEMSLLRTGYEARLESIEESSRQSSKELRQMLLSQQKMSSKWKEECKALGQKIEGKLSELRSQLAMHKKRNDDLTNHIAQLREQHLQSEDELGRQADLNKKLRQKVEAAEQQATDVTRKLSERSAKERRLAHDKRQLQEQLDKIRNQLTKSDRVGGLTAAYLPSSSLVSRGLTRSTRPNPAPRGKLNGHSRLAQRDNSTSNERFALRDNSNGHNRLAQREDLTSHERFPPREDITSHGRDDFVPSREFSGRDRSASIASSVHSYQSSVARSRSSSPDLSP